MQRGLIFFCCLLAQAASAQVYQWTDANGRVRFGDRPPAHAETQSLQFEEAAPRSQPGVEVRIETEEFSLSPAAREKVDRALPVSYTHLTLPTICSV